MNFEAIRQQEKENLMPTYGRFPVALVQGKGVYATDSEGKTYLDFTSGIGVNALGWCDDGWVKAVSEQAATLQHISNLYYNPVQTALAEELCRLSGFSKVFFGNSGAEANECAIKLARKFGETKAPDCKRILTLENSFHGRTVTTLAATGQDEFHHHFDPFTEGFDYAPIDDVEKVRAAVTEKTCAVMIELIQGEGGVFLLDPEFVRQLRQLCTEKGILLIADEVQTGIGRTGKLFCLSGTVSARMWSPRPRGWAAACPSAPACAARSWGRFSPAGCTALPSAAARWCARRPVICWGALPIRPFWRKWRQRARICRKNCGRFRS